ncbi:alpha/beta hydrolase family protein [Streptomyces sp. NPDC102274]|uniref:alpha/beta hydrolase family protein n=1 Tax=Streptomyces sp. NPDC102274 TaxID=3366151 RepID=UPI00381D2ADD
MKRLHRTATAAALALPVVAAGTASALPAPGQASVSVTAPATPGSAARAEAPQLPRPTGPYAVGRDTLHFTDHARPDPWVPEAGARELMVTMYYPARAGTGTPARYATTEEIRLLLESQNLEDAAPPEALSATGVHSRANARPSGGGLHPLVVLSPGFTISRYTLTSLAEDLASRGYVVAAVDHAYESVGAAFPGGRMLTCVACDKLKETKDYSIATTVRAQDVSFLLDRLTGGQPAWRHAQLIDKKRIGMAGHSLGGASAGSAMAGDSRLRAGINMDGSFHGSVPDQGLDGRPFMMLGTDDETHRPGGEDESWDTAWERLDGWKRWLTVAGADHFTFTDTPFLSEEFGLPAPELSAKRSIDLTRAYAGAFFDQHLRGIPRSLLDGPTAANPEVRFNNP